MPRRLGVAVVLAMFTLAPAGCSRPGGDGDPKKSGDPGASESPMPWAVNAREVTRFSDEEPFGPTVTISQDRTVVRKAPGGDSVATLASGTEVVKLAARGGDVLVCFEEPSPGTRHLMGWVPSPALSEPTLADDGGAPPPDPPDPPPPRGPKHHRHGKHRGRHPPPQQ